MSIPLDSVHGMIGQVVPGDRIDIYANLNGSVKAIMQNVLVLGVTGGTTGGLSSSSTGSSAMTLRLSPSGASRLAFASDNGKIWVILRPATRGGQIGANLMTLQQILSSSKTVPEGH